MRTTEEYRQLQIYWANKWRGILSTEPVFELTPYAEVLESEVKELSDKLNDKRRELHVAKTLFVQIQKERAVQARKKELGLSEPVMALLEEVYERTNESTKLKGNNYGYRHNLPLAYADIRNFVKNGSYGVHADLSNGRKWNPVFITHRLLQSAAQIMFYDTAKKGLNLSRRVDHALAEAWKVYNDPNVSHLPFTK